MILRKPYAFIIKHFKIIHFIMFLLALYILTQFSSIVTFFSEYVSNNYSLTNTGDFSGLYFDFLLYVAIFIIFIILIFIIMLLRYKHKKQKFYTITILYYMILFGFVIFFNYVFDVLETGVISANTARFYDEIALMLYVPQFAFLFYFLIRALGFNIKQFNFRDEKAEFNLNEQDREEAEISVELNTYKAKRKFNRFKREAKYYFLENWFMIVITLIAVGIYLFYIFSVEVAVFRDNIFNQGQILYHNNLELTVTESYITNTKLDGETFADDVYYLVLRIKIDNKTEKNIDLDVNDLRIYINGEYYNPAVNVNKEFVDFGVGYTQQSIKYNSENTYIIPYKISKDDITEDIDLKISAGTRTQNNNVYPIYNVVNLSPVLFDETVVEGSYKIGDTVDFVNSMIGKSTLNITDYLYTNTYYYEYQSCIYDNCVNYTDVIYAGLSEYGNNQTLLILNGTLLLDETTPYYKAHDDEQDFIYNFIKITYSYNGNEVTEDVSSVRQTNDLDDILVLKVPVESKNSEIIKLSIKIRNRLYEYVIKN